MTIQENLHWAMEKWNLNNTNTIYERENKAVYGSE